VIDMELVRGNAEGKECLALNREVLFVG